jgi:hypothetical protein
VFRYLNCYGKIYRLMESNYREVVRMLAKGEPFNLADWGDDYTNLSICGQIIDIGTMTREEAQQIIGGF